MRAGPPVQLQDRLVRGDRLTVDRHRRATVERDDDLVRVALHRRVGRVRVDVLDRTVPDVLQEAGLDGAAPQVLVDRVWRLVRHVDRQALLLRVRDGLLPRPRVVPHRRDHLEVRGERADPDLEPHLVVALAGAAVRDVRRAVLARGCDQVPHDQRPGQCGDQRVAVHVERVGAQRGQAVVLGELGTGVDDVRLDRAAGERALPDGVEVLTALADIDGDGDDVGARLLGDPTDRH